MLKKHSKSVKVVRGERKKIREDDPLSIVSSAGSVVNSEPVIPTIYVMLPEDDSISVQTGPNLIDIACQTTFDSKHLV